MENIHFKVITTCYNVEQWIRFCVMSVVMQNYQNWEMFIVNDCSTDKTLKILEKLSSKDDRIHVMTNKERSLKIRNFLRAVKHAQPNNEDVLVFIDGDDWLSDLNVFKHLCLVYNENETWITWGSYIDNPGDPKVFGDYERTKNCSQFAYPAPKAWNVRHSWRYSHLKTFKYFLWKNIRDDAFIEEKTGEIFTQTDDLTFMYPMLEMAGPDHAQFIYRLMYVRNTFNNLANASVHIITKEKENSQEIRARKPYPKRTRRELYENRGKELSHGYSRTDA